MWAYLGAKNALNQRNNRSNNIGKKVTDMASQNYDLILKNGTVILPGITACTDVGVRGGKIAVIGNLSAGDAAEVIDCSGLHVLPGVIDTQVHFRI